MIPKFPVMLFAIVAGLALPASVYSQCQTGVNMPPVNTTSGYPVAFPKYGHRVWNPNASVWVSYPTNGAKYVYCDAYGSNCVRGIGDQSFYASHKSAMNTAFTNWSNAKVQNGSGVGFYVGSSSWYNDYLEIEVWRASSTGPYAALTHFNMSLTDTNGDNIGDTYRLGFSWTEIDSAYSGSNLTKIMAHEVGHSMGLDDCASCSYQTTAMIDMQPLSWYLQGPSSCDNQAVSGQMY